MSKTTSKTVVHLQAQRTQVVTLTSWIVFSNRESNISVGFVRIRRWEIMLKGEAKLAHLPDIQ